MNEQIEHDLIGHSPIKQDPNDDLAIIDDIIKEGYDYLKKCLSQDGVFFEAYHMLYLNNELADDGLEKYTESLALELNGSVLWDKYIDQSNIEDIYFTIIKMFSTVKNDLVKRNALLKNIFFTPSDKMIDVILYFSNGVITGKQYETRSFLSFFSFDDPVNQIENAKLIILTFRTIYEKFHNKKILLKLLHNAIKSNIVLSYIGADLNTLQNCSNANFITILMYISFDIYNIFINKDMEINETKQDRSEYEIYDNDDLNTMLFYVVHKCIYVCYIPMFEIKKSLEKQLEGSTLLTSLFGGMPISANTIILRNTIDQIENIILNPLISNKMIDIYNLLYYQVEKNIGLNILNDSITFSFNEFFSNMVINLKMNDQDETICYFLDNIIGGRYKSNKHVRHQCATISYKINRNELNVTPNTVINFIKYFNEIDYFGWLVRDMSLKHTLSFFKSFKKICSLLKYFFDVQEQHIKKFIFNICNKILSIAEIVAVYSQRLDEMAGLTLAETNKIFKKYILCEFLAIESLVNFIKSIKKHSNYEHFPSEIISTFANSQCSVIKHISNKYYLTRPETTTLFQSCFANINDLIKLNNFTANQELLNYEQLLTCELYNDYNALFIEYIANINGKGKNIVIPDEFIDQLTCKMIIDPVMLPAINDAFFDRSTILTHLYTSETNPYNRESMTIDSFNEYNNSEEIMNKINNFKEKLNKFIISAQL
jgi:hypothetical protein